MKKLIKKIWIFIRVDLVFGYNKLLTPKKYKSNFRFENSFEFIPYNRIAVINAAFKAIKSDDDVSYLEIGCNTNDTFYSIPSEKKIGVDPYSGGTHRTTSDDFFEKNQSLFDCVFIDGFHTYSQVRRDAIHSSINLKDRGIILLHDFLPRNWESAIPNNMRQVSNSWNGDCFKFAFELLDRNIEFKIVNVDHGIMLLAGEETIDSIKKLPQLLEKFYEDISFDYYYENYHRLPIIEFTEYCKLLRNSSKLS